MRRVRRRIAKSQRHAVAVMVQETLTLDDVTVTTLSSVAMIQALDQ
jgi:hypothetical protein